MFSCSFNRQCDVSFAFGVPLTLEMTLTASASILANPSLAPQFGTTVFSSAEFDGIGDFRNLNGRSVAAQYNITLLPEPNGSLLVGGGFSCCPCWPVKNLRWVGGSAGNLTEPSRKCP